MPLPSDSSQPHLASGCRWSVQGEDHVVLLPEGMIRAEGTGLAILELCDGQKSFVEIVTALCARYNSADPAKIQHDVALFLEALQQKRVVDY